MRVLVTGHLGYVGTRLVPMLLERDHEVIGSDIDLFRDCTFTGSIPEIENLGIDMRDLKAEHCAGCDAVIHLAGLSNDPLGDYRAELTREVNETASIRLAMMAKDVGVQRFLFASSCSNYGRAGEELLTESSEFRPVTPYGQSKIGAEQAIAALADERFSPTQLRAGTVYGVSPRIRFDLVLNNLIAWATATGVVQLKSDGSAWRPLLHVDDLAAAYVAILEAPRERVHNEAFNIGVTTENYQVRTIAQIVCETVPGSRVEHVARAGTDARSYRVSCDKIARALSDYRPLWTARTGADQLYRALHNNPVAVAEFEGARFNRIDHVRALIHNGQLSEDLRWSAAQPNTDNAYQNRVV